MMWIPPGIDAAERNAVEKGQEGEAGGGEAGSGADEAASLHLPLLPAGSFPQPAGGSEGCGTPGTSLRQYTGAAAPQP